MIRHHPPERFHLDLHFVHKSQNNHEIRASPIEERKRELELHPWSKIQSLWVYIATLYIAIPATIDPSRKGRMSISEQKGKEIKSR